MKKILAGLLLALSFSAFAQSTIIRGEESAGNYSNLLSTGGVLQTIVNSGSITTSSNQTDPCQSSAVAKSSVTISISSAATTSLVAPNGSQVIYVCAYVMTISQVVTTANTIKFVRGTGATCGTGTADLTGAFGTGGVTAAAPIVVASGTGHTQFKTAAADRLCVTTTIGATGFFHGVVTYVQQ